MRMSIVKVTYLLLVTMTMMPVTFRFVSIQWSEIRIPGVIIPHRAQCVRTRVLHAVNVRDITSEVLPTAARGRHYRRLSPSDDVRLDPPSSPGKNVTALCGTRQRVAERHVDAAAADTVDGTADPDPVAKQRLVRLHLLAASVAQRVAMVEGARDRRDDDDDAQDDPDQCHRALPHRR